MSELKDATVPSTGREIHTYRRYSYYENITTNPLEYFHSRPDHHYYFISPSSGFSISGQCADKKFAGEGIKKKIYKFSRRIPLQRSKSMLKRNIFARVRKTFKFCMNIASKLCEIQRRKLLYNLRKLRRRMKYLSQNKLAERNILKLYIILEKNRATAKCQSSAGEGSTKCGKVFGQICKKYKKLLMITCTTSLHTRQKHKKCITKISLFHKPRRRSSKEPKVEIKATKREPLNTPVLFMGKDPRYPPSLNQLFTPTVCNLCNVNMNSLHAADRHYTAETHIRRVKNWFHYKFPANRGVQHLSGENPSEQYCELCTITLPSPRHALQHYNGKRHRTVAFKNLQLNGVGYFDFQGNWIETKNATEKEISFQTHSGPLQVPLFNAKKLNPERKTQKKPWDPNADLGNAPKPLSKMVGLILPELKSNSMKAATSKIGYDNSNRSQASSSSYTGAYNTANFSYAPQSHPSSKCKFSNHPPVASPANPHSSEVTQSFVEAMTTLSCAACNTSATSKTQMLSHLKGARHLKKMNLNGETQTPFISIAESLLDDDPKDMSIYRTPTGYYYCDTCKLTVVDVERMGLHIASNRHTKTMREQRGEPGIQTTR